MPLLDELDIILPALLPLLFALSALPKFELLILLTLAPI